MSEFAFNLGITAWDKVSGYSGKIVARVQWLHGVNRYALQGPPLTDGKLPDIVWIDEGAVSESSP